MKYSRATIAVVIVALWLGGLGMMFRHNANRSEAQQLAEVALRVQPATFYYAVERDGQKIGAASSSLDTSATTLISEEYYVGDFPSRDSIQRTSARSQTILTRGLHLVDIKMDIARATRPFSVNAAVEEDTSLFIAGRKRSGKNPPARYTFVPPLFTASMAPVAFMLGGPHEIGRKQTLSVFDPVSRIVIRPELRIRAESLFTVVDSAQLDPSGRWVVAHQDTVRAWKIDGAPHGLNAWVDAEGRIVAARAGELSAVRTAFELAFKQTQDGPDTTRNQSSKSIAR